MRCRRGCPWSRARRPGRGARSRCAAGADVVVLEARDRAGGRVEAVTLADGRIVQAGGEVFGARPRRLPRACRRARADDRAAATSPTPARSAGGSPTACYVGDELPWMSDAGARRRRAGRAGVRARWPRPVDPDDPWAHPDVAPARRDERRRLAARAARAACRAPPLRARLAVALLRRPGADLAARRAAQARGARRRRVLRPRALGGPARRRGLGRAVALADGGRARRARAARGCRHAGSMSAPGSRRASSSTAAR